MSDEKHVSPAMMVAMAVTIAVISGALYLGFRMGERGALRGRCLDSCDREHRACVNGCEAKYRACLAGCDR